MNGWMILWSILLAGGAIGMVGLLLGVSIGAIAELKQTLAELSAADPAAADTPSPDDV